jgi:predicted  nucleic acid-binding Zn-ribbon protein
MAVIPDAYRLPIKDLKERMDKLDGYVAAAEKRENFTSSQEYHDMVNELDDAFSRISTLQSQVTNLEEKLEKAICEIPKRRRWLFSQQKP